MSEEVVVMPEIEWRPWLLVAAFSLVLFLITFTVLALARLMLRNPVRV